MTSSFEISESTAQIRFNSCSDSSQTELQQIVDSQPTLFFSLLYELYNRKSTTKDGKKTPRLSRVVSEGRLSEFGKDSEEDMAPFTWPSVVASLQDLAGDLYISPDVIEPIIQVGEGGFAKVYKSLWKGSSSHKDNDDDDEAEEEDDDKVVALKKLKNTSLEPEDLEELIGEANLMRNLNHKNIVQFYGIGAMNTSSLENMRTSLFLVQEFVGGGTIKDVINQQYDQKTVKKSKTKLYTNQDAFKWLLQIAEALAYLHEQTPMVIHRDLKPENILLTDLDRSNADAKIVDFGLHKRIKPKEDVFKVRRHQSDKCRPSTGLRQEHLPRTKTLPDLNTRCETQASSRRFSDDSAEKDNGYRLLEAFLSIDLEEKLQNMDPSLLKQLDHVNQEDCEHSVAAKLALTATGTFHSVRSSASGRAGSHLYMSPETINGEVYTEKVDVFAFGVLAYELLKGQLNVVDLTRQAQDHGWSSNEALTRYARRIALGWREKTPKKWPSEVVELVKGCWDQEPKQRPSMTIVVRWIKQLLEEKVAKKMDKKKSKSSKLFKKFMCAYS